VIGIVAVGLTSLMATMGYWFGLGAVCRGGLSGLARHQADPLPGLRRRCRGTAGRRRRAGFFLQGFVVLLSNPKVLVFFGAFIPQFYGT